MVVLNVFISTCIKISHLKNPTFTTKTWPQQSPRDNRDEVYLFQFYFPSNATVNNKGNMPCNLQSLTLKTPFDERPMHGLKMNDNVMEDKVFREVNSFQKLELILRLYIALIGVISSRCQTSRCDTTWLLCQDLRHLFVHLFAIVCVVSCVIPTSIVIAISQLKALSEVWIW